jgi:Mn-dependent DtxR family transcriptional regulator
MSLTADQTYFLKQIIASAINLGAFSHRIPRMGTATAQNYVRNQQHILKETLRCNIREFLNKGYWCGNCLHTSGNPALESEVEEYVQFIRELEENELYEAQAAEAQYMSDFIQQVSSAPPFTSAPTTEDFTHGN